MEFKKWLERFSEPLPLGDPARRPDLIRGGLDGCTGEAPNNLPMGVKSMCRPITSAFQTYKKKAKK